MIKIKQPKSKLYIVKEEFAGDKLEVESDHPLISYDHYDYFHKNKKGQYIYLYVGSSFNESKGVMLNE